MTSLLQGQLPHDAKPPTKPKEVLIMRSLPRLLASVSTASLLLIAAGCDSFESEPQDAVLVNQTGGALYFQLFNVNSARPLVSEFPIDLGNKPSGFVARGDTAVIKSCTLPDAFEEFELLLYEVRETTKVDTASAVLVRQESPDRVLDQLRRNNCRVIVDSLP